MSEDDDEDKWWARHAGDEAVAATRASLAGQAAAYLRASADAGMRSLEISVAQYWNDQADDECHTHVVGSPDADPVGLHVCPRENDTYGSDVVSPCALCDRNIDGGYDAVDGGYGPLIPAVEAFCHEGATQNEGFEYAYRPWLVARLVISDEPPDPARWVDLEGLGRWLAPAPDGDPRVAVEIEAVGALIRPWLDLPASPVARVALAEGAAVRAAELAKRLRDHAGDNSGGHSRSSPGGDLHGRVVLADALQDAGDPRGEALASGDASMALGRAWLGAFDRHVPRSALRLVHGVPDAIGLYLRAGVDQLDDRPAGDLADSLAFAFRPAVRFLPGSARSIWPGLAPARALGPLDGAALDAIAGGAVPFDAVAIEVEVADAVDLPILLAQLATARENLPRVTALRLAGRGVTRAGIDELAYFAEKIGLGRPPTDAGTGSAAAIARLEVAIDADDDADHVASVRAWRAARLGVPVTIAMYDADAQRAAGWIVGPDATVQRRRFHVRAGTARLAALTAVLR